MPSARRLLHPASLHGIYGVFEELACRSTTCSESFISVTIRNLRDEAGDDESPAASEKGFTAGIFYNHCVLHMIHMQTRENASKMNG